MKQTSSSAKSKTDSARLKSDSKSTKLSAEHPEANIGHIVRGDVRRGLKPLPSLRSTHSVELAKNKSLAKDSH